MLELTPEHLQELRRIAEAAPPGPWAWREGRGGKILDLIGYGEEIVTPSHFNASLKVKGGVKEYIQAFDPTTALALLDRIEALEAFVWAEHAIREHASTCVYWGWKPGACPNGVCGQLKAQREEAYRRALEAMGIKDSYKPLNHWEEG